MALVKDPVGRARALGDKQLSKAAQLYADLDTELALNPDLDPAWEAQAEEATGLLEDRFGGRERLEELAVDRGKSPNLSRKADAQIASGPQHPPAGSASPASGKPSGSSSSASSPRSSQGRPGRGRPATSARPRRRASSRRGRGGRRAFARTGLPRMADSASGVALQIVGGTVALTLLYVFIAPKPKGATQTGADALAGAAGVFVTGLRMVLQPTDPLAPKAAAKGKGGFVGGFGGGDFGPADTAQHSVQSKRPYGAGVAMANQPTRSPIAATRVATP